MSCGTYFGLSKFRLIDSRLDILKEIIDLKKLNNVSLFLD